MSDFTEQFHRRVTCRIIGHNWKMKLRGRVCKRCNIFTPRMPTEF